MGSPKNITESLSRWQGQPLEASEPLSPTPSPAPVMPVRRLSVDLAGGFIYTLVIGALLSQVVFLIAFDLL